MDVDERGLIVQEWHALADPRGYLLARQRERLRLGRSG
jgi:hypothetical protein